MSKLFLKLLSRETIGILVRLLIFLLGAIVSTYYLGILVGIVIGLSGFLYEVLYHVIPDRELKNSLDTLANKINSPTISIPINLLMGKEYINLPEKLTSPIQVFVNKKITEALEDLFRIEETSTGAKHFQPERIKSGMVWTILDADIKTYAIVAKHFDEKVIEDEQGYIWSTNVTDPSEFDELTKSGNNILMHINLANGKANNKIRIDNSEIPALLRLQLVRKEKKGIIPDKESFCNSLQGSNNAKEYYFKKDLLNKNVFILDVSEIENKEGKDFEKLGYFLGDYIVYSDMIVVKWDEKANVLYLIFGREVIEAYKNIFITFWKEWKDNKKKKNITEDIKTIV